MDGSRRHLIEDRQITISQVEQILDLYGQIQAACQKAQQRFQSVNRTDSAARSRQREVVQRTQ